MKYFLITFILVNLSLTAQDARHQQQDFKIEWKEELTGTYPVVSGLVTVGDRIYITQTGDQVGSAFNIFSAAGNLLYNSQTYVRIRSFFLNDGALYSMGDQQLTKRSPAGDIISEYSLPWKNGEYISSRNGKILNNRAYTTNWHNDFLKFSLTGEQLFRKEIGTLTDNHFLDVGGNHIYVYSSITKPLNEARLMQYDTLGNQKWSVGVGDVRALIADAQGNCFVSAANGESTISKFDHNGKIVWFTLVKGQHVKGMSIRGDSVFVCGHISLNSVPANWQKSCYSIISATSGKILSQQVVDVYEDPNEGEFFSVIASDGQNIYCGGTRGDQGPSSFLLKLSREGSATGIKDEKANGSDFTIFPNPGGSKFTISCANNELSAVNVTVRSISGQVVYSKKVECNSDKSFTLDLGKQAAGSYTIEIFSGSERMIKRVVIE
jgi:hypothetical protein